MIRFTQHHARRFGHAIRGLCTAFTHDRHFKLQVLSGIFFLLFGYSVSPLSDTEIIFLLLSYILILITELQNSSLEKALDRLHPELHEDIKISKDTAAGAVLLSGVFALGVVLVIALSRI